jgi:hypothetical protein
LQGLSHYFQCYDPRVTAKYIEAGYAWAVVDFPVVFISNKTAITRELASLICKLTARGMAQNAIHEMLTEIKAEQFTVAQIASQSELKHLMHYKGQPPMAVSLRRGAIGSDLC